MSGWAYTFDVRPLGMCDPYAVVCSLGCHHLCHSSAQSHPSFPHELFALEILGPVGRPMGSSRKFSLFLNWAVCVKAENDLRCSLCLTSAFNNLQVSCSSENLEHTVFDLFAKALESRSRISTKFFAPSHSRSKKKSLSHRGTLFKESRSSRIKD